MVNRSILGALAAALGLLLGDRAGAATKIYAIQVGVNEPPQPSRLASLRYADDDAARLHDFFRSFSDEAYLVAVLDAQTQKIFPDLAPRALAPTRRTLEHVTRRIATRIQADRSAGHQTVVYVSYSGHGVPGATGTRLALHDGSIDRRWLEKHVLRLSADRVHLIVDACHAEGIVAGRGGIRRVVSSRARAVTSDERSALTDSALLKNYPHVGVLLASSVSNEAHEWSRLGAGVFTHELLSALAGAADVNRDGEIAYSEVAAFMSAANGAVPDPRAVPAIVSSPPLLDRNTSLLSMDWISSRALLVGTLCERFHIETETGIRLLDANLEEGLEMALIVPSERRLWLRVGKREASFSARAGEMIRIDELSFQSSEEISQRGSVAEALHHGLFGTPYGRAFYRGWIGRLGEVGVDLIVPAPERDGPSALSPVDATVTASNSPATPSFLPALLTIVGSTALAGNSAYLVYRAAQDKQRVESTPLQRPGAEAKDEMMQHGGIAIGSAILSIGLGVAAWYFWPESDSGFAPLPATRRQVADTWAPHQAPQPHHSSE